MPVSEKINNTPHKTRKMILISVSIFVGLVIFTTIGLWRTKMPSAEKSVLGEGLSNALSSKTNSLPSLDDVKEKISNDIERVATEQAKNKISQQTFLHTTYDNELVSNETKILRNTAVTVQKIRFNPGVTVVWLNISNQSNTEVTIDLAKSTLGTTVKSSSAGDLFDSALQVSLAGFGEPLKQKFTLQPQQEKWGFLLFDPMAMKGSATLLLSTITNSQTNQSWEYAFDLNFDELAKAKPSTK